MHYYSRISWASFPGGNRVGEFNFFAPSSIAGNAEQGLIESNHASDEYLIISH